MNSRKIVVLTMICTAFVSMIVAVSGYGPGMSWMNKSRIAFGWGMCFACGTIALSLAWSCPEPTGSSGENDG